MKTFCHAGAHFEDPPTPSSVAEVLRECEPRPRPSLDESDLLEEPSTPETGTYILFHTIPERTSVEMVPR